GVPFMRSRRTSPIWRSTGPSGLSPKETRPSTSLARLLILASDIPVPAPRRAGSSLARACLTPSRNALIARSEYSGLGSCLYLSPRNKGASPGGPTSGAEWVWVAVHQICCRLTPVSFSSCLNESSTSDGETRARSDDGRVKSVFPSLRATIRWYSLSCTPSDCLAA